MSFMDKKTFPKKESQGPQKTGGKGVLPIKQNEGLPEDWTFCLFVLFFVQRDLITFRNK